MLPFKQEAGAFESTAAGFKPVAGQALRAYRKVYQIVSKPAASSLPVDRYMSYPVTTLSQSMSLPDALLAFERLGYRQMPVVDEWQRVVGQLSKSDLLECIIIDVDRLHYLPGKSIAGIMSTKFLTATVSTDVSYLARVMQDRGITAALILNADESLAGILSRSDMVKVVANGPKSDSWM